MQNTKESGVTALFLLFVCVVKTLCVFVYILALLLFCICLQCWFIKEEGRNGEPLEGFEKNDA